MQDLFSRLIAAFGEARLRQHMDERRVLRIAEPGHDFTALLGFDELSAALAQGVFPAAKLRVMCGRRQVDAERVDLVRDGQIMPAVLAQLARQGATLVVNAVDHGLPAIWDLCREGEALLGEELGAAAFTSFGSDSGLSPHTDDYDVIIVQLAGTKHWHFHGDPVPLAFPPRASRAREAAPGPVTRIETLRTGEIMFVPAGLYHHCSADGGSMHLSIIWRRRHGAALAQRLFRQAASDSFLSAPIALMPGEEAVAARLAASKARLIEWITAFDASALLEIPRAREKRPETRPAGPLASGPRLAVALPGAADPVRPA